MPDLPITGPAIAAMPEGHAAQGQGFGPIRAQRSEGTVGCRRERR
jgi:hypothetical protein